MTTTAEHQFDARALGIGVYAASEALRLIDFRREADSTVRPLSRSTMSRWLRGYRCKEGGEWRTAPPLWAPDYSGGEHDPLEVSFRDLVELRFANILRDLGLSLRTIDACFAIGAEQADDPRPFSSRRFQVDGWTIFLRMMESVAGDGELADLSSKQRVFRTIIEPSLGDLDFDDGVVTRWLPLGRGRPGVVLDPRFFFGRPILRDFGVATRAISEAIDVEGSIEAVARLYELPVAAVREARTFEDRLAA